MKMSQVLIGFALTAGLTCSAVASESLGEKGSATANDVKRSAKKGWNRTKEAFCAEGDVTCAAKKAKNKVGEGVDYTKDKGHEVKDSVDSDEKARE
ncbi:MAG: hypothetical protein ACAH59_14360 [Pseudobdellovibrionaceae bacterium]